MRRSYYCLWEATCRQLYKITQYRIQRNKSSLTSKKVVSLPFRVIICGRWVFKKRICQSKVFIFLFRVSMIKAPKKLIWPFAFEGLWRVKRSYLTVTTFYVGNYCLFVSWKNLGKTAKRSNELIIVVLNCVRMMIFSFCKNKFIRYIMLRCSTAARITHKGRNWQLQPFTTMHFLQRWHVKMYTEIVFFQTMN